VATLEDYEQVRKLIRGLVMESTERGVSKRLRETVQAVTEICSGDGEPRPVFGESGAAVAAIAQRLNLDRSTALRRVQECLKRELLRPVGEWKKGRKLIVTLGEPLSENEEILPSAEQVGDEMNEG